MTISQLVARFCYKHFHFFIILDKNGVCFYDKKLEDELTYLYPWKRSNMQNKFLSTFWQREFRTRREIELLNIVFEEHIMEGQ